jgi:hypothetical protein
LGLLSSYKGQIYVGGLPSNVRTREIEDLFHKYGRIVDIAIKESVEQGCYAFVIFDDAKDAGDAVRGRNGADFDGRRLRCVSLQNAGPLLLQKRTSKTIVFIAFLEIRKLLFACLLCVLVPWGASVRGASHAASVERSHTTRDRSARFTGEHSDHRIRVTGLPTTCSWQVSVALPRFV